MLYAVLGLKGLIGTLYFEILVAAETCLHCHTVHSVGKAKSKFYWVKGVARPRAEGA